jgi:hypothetical protein
MKYLLGNSTLVKSIRTAIEAFLGFIVGLCATIWAVPGVPEAVYLYVQQNFASVLLTIGVPAGIASGFITYGVLKGIEKLQK